jgi:hypothetical protein
MAVKKVFASFRLFGKKGPPDMIGSQGGGIKPKSGGTAVKGRMVPCRPFFLNTRGGDYSR